MIKKTYNPHHIEKNWYQIWEKANYFMPQGDGTPYCIMLPPPNVTGSLHMGHGFQHTLMDTLIRYHRMQKNKTLWQAGVDHAGISTQIVVEKQLEKQQKSRQQLGRKAFLEKVWQWKEISGNQITQQLRRMGSSIDWSRERFTMDEELSRAVKKVFIQLYQEKLIYRGKRLVNWDPKLGTVISDLEVISTEETGHLWHVRYPFAEGDGFLTVATTRPETLLGDVAVAVHPEDDRYRHLIGQQLRLPLSERLIPIIADEYVDPTFGSGCVKITPAHDFNDYAMAKRHQLASINIFTPEITLNDNVPPAYQGLTRHLARKKVVIDLQEKQLIEKIETHTLKIPRGEKTGEVIEPYLTEQWFLNVKPLVEPAIQAVEKGKIRFVPENWTKTYFQWMHNLEDWCISRQLWWGHRIPAWYDQQGHIYVGESENDVRQKHKLSKDIILQQDEDVLDTWFSAALWPFATLGWPEKTAELKTYYPTNVLVTGFDIIFFWVARMIMMGLKFTGQAPFKEVYITGLIRDAEGKKMSKSKGNVLDPIDLIDGIELQALIKKRTHNLMLDSLADKIAEATRKEFPKGIPAFGTDALRFTYCALAGTGRDIYFDLGRVEGYSNFCNKLWNAARFVLINVEEEKQDLGDGALQYSLADRWIISRLQHTISKVRQHLDQYRFDLLANELHEFIWHEYCDWYLELSKPILYSKSISAAEKRGTRYRLITILETLLRLLHPIMPFITEEIWQKTAKFASISGDTIMLQPYPTVDDQVINLDSEAEIQWLKTIVLGIRQIRGEMNIPPNKPLTILLNKGDKIDKKRLKKNHLYLTNLAKLENITWLYPNDPIPPCATALAGEMEILIPLSGLIDKTDELARLDKTITKLQQDITKTENKLNNADFTEKAPASVVAREKKRHSELQSALDKLKAQQQKFQLL